MIGQIGRLDTRITIQAPTDAVDAQGSPTLTWATIGTVWANVKAMDAGMGTANAEATNGHERSAGLIYQFTVRRQASIAATSARHRIQWSGHNFDITAVQPMPEGRPDHLIITAIRKA